MVVVAGVVVLGVEIGVASSYPEDFFVETHILFDFAWISGDVGLEPGHWGHRTTLPHHMLFFGVIGKHMGHLSPKSLKSMWNRRLHHLRVQNPGVGGSCHNSVGVGVGASYPHVGIDAGSSWAAAGPSGLATLEDRLDLSMNDFVVSWVGGGNNWTVRVVGSLPFVTYNLIKISINNCN